MSSRPWALGYGTRAHVAAQRPEAGRAVSARRIDSRPKLPDIRAIINSPGLLLNFGNVRFSPGLCAIVSTLIVSKPYMEPN